MTSDVEHLFMWLLAIFYLLGGKAIQVPCPFFKWVVLLLSGLY